MLGLSPARGQAARTTSVIEFAELEDFVDLKLKNYSSGMYVRLAFSVAIQVDADILLIDEVLAVGDAAFQQKCFDVFTRMRDEGKTILFVTHDMGAVQRFCDRALLLEQGDVVALASPADRRTLLRDQLRAEMPARRGRSPRTLRDGDGERPRRRRSGWRPECGMSGTRSCRATAASLSVRVRFDVDGRRPVIRPDMW